MYLSMVYGRREELSLHSVKQLERLASEPAQYQFRIKLFNFSTQTENKVIGETDRPPLTKTSPFVVF